MMTSQGCGVLLYLAFFSLTIASWCLIANASPNTNEDEGKTWALLVAGSNGYMNYRHQADVCHAYQILKKSGMNDEIIIVFMYDDIALAEDNPKPGVIINKPDGKDVYKGVPKDCTKDDVNAGNLYAVILGNKSALSGGSGKVRKRTNASHVMEYGDMSHRQDVLSTYMGGAPASNPSYTSTSIKDTSASSSRVVSQLDADLIYFQHKFHGAPTGSQKKLEAQKQLLDEIAQREHADYSVKKIGELLFGNEMASKVLMNVRPPGQPLVDDWDCFKTLLETYERRCGGLSRYGRKYTRAIANICNAGISMEKMDAASHEACSKKPHL